MKIFILKQSESYVMDYGINLSSPPKGLLPMYGEYAL
jgi:hypothetical protein